MKFCIINSLFLPFSRGGVEVVVERIIDGLLQSGHEVVLITLGRNEGVVTKGNLRIYRITPFNIFSFIDINSRPIWLRVFWHPLDVFNISGALKVRKILAQEKPSVVMTHNLKGISYLTPFVVRRLGIWHVHTVHDVQLSRPSGLLLYGQEKPFLVIDKIYEKVCRWLFGSPDVVISPSNWLLNYYRIRGFFYHSNKVVVSNPIVFKKVEKSGPKSELINLIFVGQLIDSKGILFLVQACKKMSAKNWQLMIVGDGSQKKQLEQLTQGDDRFKIVGFVNQEKLFEFYRQADLSIVPSVCYENSPSVVYESLVANVPVVASDIGGISEIVKDNYNGFTFTPGNEKNLIEVLEYFLNHPEKIEELRKSCFLSVRNFSINNYIKQLTSLVKLL